MKAKQLILPSLISVLLLNVCSKKPELQVETSPAEEPELIIPKNPTPKKFTSEAVAFFRQNRLFNHAEETPQGAELNTKLLDQIEAILDVGSRVSTVGIDLILMQHNSFDEDNKFGYDDGSRYSQHIVYKLLEQNDYDVIGFEGSALEVVTISGLKEEIREMLKRSGSRHVSAALEGLERNFQETVREDGVLRFYDDHPEAFVVGTEMYPINILSELLLYMEHDVYSERADHIINLRTELALARTLILAARRDLSKAAIVIGAGHGQYLVTLAKEWACGGQFYRALTDEAKQHPSHALE